MKRGASRGGWGATAIAAALVLASCGAQTDAPDGAPASGSPTQDQDDSSSEPSAGATQDDAETSADTAADSSEGDSHDDAESSADTAADSSEGDSQDDAESSADSATECSESADVAASPDPFAYRDGGVGGDDLPCWMIEEARSAVERGLNTPKRDPEFHLLYGDIVTPEMEAEYRHWMGILVESLGGFDRFVHAIYEAGSPDSENTAVIEGLDGLGFFEHNFDEERAPSLEAVFERRSCLSGFQSGDGDYSFCNQPEHWTDPDREFHRDMMGSLYFSYEILHEFAHEYHHHVQGANSLGKMGVSNGPDDPIPPDGFGPAWYIEGSAGISPGWILRDEFDELPLSKRLGLTYDEMVEVNGDLAGLLNANCDAGSAEDVQNAQPGPDGRRITFAQEFYPDEQMARIGYEEQSHWGCLNLYLMHLTSPQVLFVSFLEDNWSLGWAGSFLKHTGMTMDEFYADFESEMMSVDVNDPDTLPEWMTAGLPEERFVDVVDYWSINSSPHSG